MGIYGRWILPRLIDWTIRAEDLAGLRCRLVRRAQGRVLEVGFGSGLNLPLYGPGAEMVIGLDPSAELLRRATPLVAHVAFPVHLVRATAEAIPLVEASVDTTVMAWTLCSLEDARAGLGEMRRVLRPNGELLFVEHGLAPDPETAAWQRRLNPLWTRISCYLKKPGGSDAARNWVRRCRAPLRVSRQRPAADDLHVRGPGATDSGGRAVSRMPDAKSSPPDPACQVPGATL